MLSKVFFIGENSIAVRRSNARRKTNRLGPGALIFADTTPKAGLRFVESHWKRFSNQWRR